MEVVVVALAAVHLTDGGDGKVPTKVVQLVAEIQSSVTAVTGAVIPAAISPQIKGIERTTMTRCLEELHAV